MTEANTRPAFNNDGMMNVLTGLGTQKDVSRAGTYAADPLLDKSTLEALFAGDGLGRRIVEMPAEEALRQWFKIEGDDGDVICGELEALDAAKHLADALVWARLYGGAGIVRLINDGGNLDDPLNRDSIRKVIGYRVMDRHRITWNTSDISQDANSSQFGQPEIYTIYPSNGVQYRVHHSRICIIDGMRLPDTVRDSNQGWGASALQGAWSYLMRVGQNYGYTSNIMRDFVQAVLSVNGLTDMLANGQDDLVKKRINMLDLSRSILNAMIIDGEGEAYQKQASSVAGIADLMDRHMEGLCGVVGIPMSKLVGRAPGGMSSTGDAEQRDYYDGLTAMRSTMTGKATETMVRDLYDARGGEPDQWRIKWNSLYQPTDAEKSATEKAIAETDNIYWQMGAIDAAEVRSKRFADLDEESGDRGDAYNADAGEVVLGPEVFEAMNETS